MSQVLALIAGDGDLPLEIARAARVRGQRVHAVALHKLTSSALEPLVDTIEWLHVGQIRALLRTLREAGAQDAVMAGKVAKTHLFDPAKDFRPDEKAIEMLGLLPDRRDDSILIAIADLLEDEGITVHPQAELVPQLKAGEGALGKVQPTDAQQQDIAFGWPIAKMIAGRDIGQCVVVKQQSVLALEAIEGTDAAVHRGGVLGGPGACVIKVAKPRQDPRFDVPAIGPQTLESLIEAEAAVLAYEAEQTLVLRRQELVEAADASGIALVGVVSESVLVRPGASR